ncbi:hypothetical protein BST61_g7825 [Cercospora zeina]
MEKIRKFSTTAAKAVKQWAINGTTENATDPAHVIHKAFQNYQELSSLKDKAQYAIINGNPHPTPYRDGTIDPEHISGVLIISDKERYPFHFYTEAGARKIKFNDKSIAEIPISDAFYEQAATEGNAEETLWFFDRKKNTFVKWDSARAKYVEGFTGKKEDGPWKGVEKPWEEKEK